MDSLNSLKAITEEDRIKRYFASKAINNSLLKKVERPAWIRWWEEHTQVEDDDNRYFRIGRAVDCMLTDKDNFHNQFFCFTQKRPSGLMGKFIDKLPLFALNEEKWHSDESERVINTGLYLRAFSYANYASRTNILTVIKDFWTKGDNCGYYRAREQANGKEILSIDEMDEIETATQALEQLPDIREYFGRDPNNPTNCYYQVPLYHSVKEHDEHSEFIGEGEVVNYKGLLDLVLVDHFLMTIEPIDLKTTAMDVELFEEAFYRLGYHRQAAFYDYLLRNADGYFKRLQEQGYTILPFKFIVAPKKEYFGQSALKFIVSEETMNIGRNGGYAQINGVPRHVRGIFEYMDAYRFHRKFNIWNVPRWIYEKNYELTL